MPTADAMLKLAERCEQATGPDRELNALIFKALGAPVPFQFANKLVALSFDEAEQCYFAPIGDMRVRYTPPTYTASLDAAMTLVPEGHDVQVHLFFGRDGEGSAIVSRLKKIGQARIFAATPALVLCAAALRARSA